MIKTLLFMVSLSLGMVVAAAPVTHLAIGTKGSEIAFDKTKLSAKKGSIEITFTNQSDAEAAMPHNFVLTKPATNTDDIGAAGITAGAGKNYVPDSPLVVKATAILNAGQSEKIVVQLEPGVYPYLCSYPGHAALMKGTLTVK